MFTESDFNCDNTTNRGFMEFKNYIRSIPDHPKPGITFRDITTLPENPEIIKKATDTIAQACHGMKVDKVAVIESRGFLLGGALAYILGAGLVIIRKKGKLPYKTYSVNYDLEYGTDTIEIHQDAIQPGQRVLLHDDLLATGGTMAAAAELIKVSGGQIIAATFLIELDFLNGRTVLQSAGIPTIYSLIHYQSE